MLQDLSLQNERFTWARVSQTKTRWIYIYQFSQERSDWQHRAMSTWDVTLPERVATEGSHNTLTWGEQRVSTWAVQQRTPLARACLRGTSRPMAFFVDILYRSTAPIKTLFTSLLYTTFVYIITRKISRFYFVSTAFFILWHQWRVLPMFLRVLPMFLGEEV